ncbi:MAG: adenylyltransferase/cytidyltransferase family protein [Bacteroidia bacterium]|jgi:pantetheine-phosphate adenylyltransferase|nr:adenylyltransferase/cytidyltransferase family protein [Bacteroidia bacterium]
MNYFDDGAFFEKAQPLNTCLRHELEQFKLHQNQPFSNYKKQRLTFLKQKPNSNFNAEFLQEFHPKIAVFAGSFNPFHKGHFNVLQKAERIFDKVIIAFGQNPIKEERTWEIPKSIQNRQIEHYNSLLTDLLITLGDDPVLIRGLRNSTDFQYEQNQYRYMQELMPNINIVNIYCDKEFEHISSSGIRTLEKFNKHHKYLLE